MSQRSAWIVRPLVALLVLACVSCSADDGAPTKRSAAPERPSNIAAAQLVADSKPTATVPLPAELRLAMEKSFAHHAVLMLRLMRAHIDKEPKSVAATRGALQRNTKEITDVAVAVYGADEAGPFIKLWNKRVRALNAYAAAHAKNDEAALLKASEALRAYPDLYGEAVNKMTRGKLPEALSSHRMGAHLTVVVAAADAYADSNFAAAYARERTAYSQMFDLGTGFAKAAVLTRLGYLPPAFDDRAAQLRSGIAGLLAEHAALASETTQAVVSGNPAAEDAAAALNKNTKDLLGALGRRPAQQFSDPWAASIEAIVAFAVGVAESDKAAQSQARAVLDETPTTLGARLSTLSGGKVGADTIAGGFRTQFTQGLYAVMAYAAEEYETSAELAYRQYDHMFVQARTMAKVLEGFVSKKAPVGGAKTGVGAMVSR